jgi:hypothetical protein
MTCAQPRLPLRQSILNELHRSGEIVSILRFATDQGFSNYNNVLRVMLSMEKEGLIEILRHGHGRPYYVRLLNG